MSKKRKPEIVIKKDFLYRGKTLEYLKTLDVRESAKFLPSPSRRSILKGFDMIEKFIKRCEKKIARGKRIKTQKRAVVIVPKLVGMVIGVHNGKNFSDVEIQPEMIGHRLGEFAPTRNRVHHGSAGLGATKGSRALKK